MANGIGIKVFAGEHTAPTGTKGETELDVPRRMSAQSAPVSRSGTWKITWQRGADQSDLYVQTFHDLFERQLNTFVSPRVFLLGKPHDHELSKLRTRVSELAVGEDHTSPGADFDVVWDAGLLSWAQLPERLRLVRALDERLKVGGSCIVVTHGERAMDATFAALSPEEVAAYFFPSYVVVKHEEHEFALPPGRPVSFYTTTLFKQSALTSEMLDPELHRSLHAVASKRRVP